MSVPDARSMLLVAHTGRPDGLQTARAVARRLCAAGVTVRVLKSEADDLGCPDTTVLPVSPDAAAGAEMVVVIGGDGTLLRAAELARPVGAPLLGVNLGHVGFLAETEPDVLGDAVDHILDGHYWVERRMTVDVTIRQNGSVLASAWALNEATVEKAARERMLDLVTEVDGRPLSRWGCDGIVFATPTGSTAYAFSAGGPVVWPDVEALLLVPISAHALFAGPMVVSPESVLAVEVIGATGSTGETSGAVLWCDGRRKVELPPGTRVEVRRGAMPVLLARLRHDADGETGADGHRTVIGASFTDRLVVKFGLPVSGWHGRAEAKHDARRNAARRDEEPAGDA
ncbi:MAG TPA: NAD kinase [Streptosporangiaceae bacterium]|nr:NAD kinase [Streptosporangiaceae bacterium]